MKPLEKSNELGFLYPLVYSETNNKNNTNIYNVKVFDPAAQKIEQIAKAVLPCDLVDIYPFFNMQMENFFTSNLFIVLSHRVKLVHLI